MSHMRFGRSDSHFRRTTHDAFTQYASFFQRLQDMKKLILVTGILASVMLTRIAAGDLQLPPFLPNYYAPAFEIGGEQLLLVDRLVENDVARFFYATEDQSLGLSIENIKCDQPRCAAVFRNILGVLNDRITSSAGKFHTVAKRELYAEAREAGLERSFFVYVLPTSIQIWTYVSRSGVTPGLDTMFDTVFGTIGGLVNRHRYKIALSMGNVAMGNWGQEVHEHARRLLQEGRKRAGLAVLRDLLATSPSNYDAHVDLMENTTNFAAARASAGVVYKNAENPEHIDKAVKYLGIQVATFESIPLLEKNETGLQLILIPLPPCNLWLLEDAAKTYEKITGVPVKIRRLKEEWRFTAPDRVYSQRNIQSILVKQKGENIDFAGWNKARYATELLKVVESEHALSRYEVRDFIDKMNKRPGQYLADPLLDWFSSRLEDYRSGDNRTMYVGITEVNIYSGDNNYVFSVANIGETSPASVFSYSMMLAEAFSDEYEYESKQRLTERIAKELVPASLKQLRIPRPLDPTDPFSYANSVTRLDQKTLNLSDVVKDALKRFRGDQKYPAE